MLGVGRPSEPTYLRLETRMEGSPRGEMQRPQRGCLADCWQCIRSTVHLLCGDLHGDDVPTQEARASVSPRGPHDHLYQAPVVVPQTGQPSTGASSSRLFHYEDTTADAERGRLLPKTREASADLDATSRGGASSAAAGSHSKDIRHRGASASSTQAGGIGASAAASSSSKTALSVAAAATAAAAAVAAAATATATAAVAVSITTEADKAAHRRKASAGSAGEAFGFPGEKGLKVAVSDQDEDDDFCPTCLEQYTEDNPKMWTECGHHFHLPCTMEWLERKDTCPMCESKIVIPGFE